MTGEQLEAEFEAHGMRRGGVLLLCPEDAIKLVDRAREAGVRVLGLDAFQVGVSFTQSFLEHSTDYSAPSHARVIDPWAEAERFLSGFRGSPFLFEVVLSA